MLKLVANASVPDETSGYLCTCFSGFNPRAVSWTNNNDQQSTEKTRPNNTTGTSKLLVAGLSHTEKLITHILVYPPSFQDHAIGRRFEMR